MSKIGHIKRIKKTRGILSIVRYRGKREVGSYSGTEGRESDEWVKWKNKMKWGLECGMITS